MPPLCSFKFQYDSINTCPRPEGQVEKESLNSNMILLILNTVGKEKEVTTVFKFQYDSINTAKTLHSLVPDICFKFQYDSINTSSCTSLRWPSVIFKFQYDSINTLIRFIALCAFADFKFQSDSINTLSALSFLQVLSALNSNMILLIRIIGASLSFEKVL